jgi:hypothetical protein
MSSAIATEAAITKLAASASPVPIRNSFGGGRSIGRLRLQNAVLDFLLFSGSEGVENLEADGPSFSVADGRQRPPPEQPSVTRRCSAASTEKSMLKYQTIESYAPLARMSELIAF